VPESLGLQIPVVVVSETKKYAQAVEAGVFYPYPVKGGDAASG